MTLNKALNKRAEIAQEKLTLARREWQAVVVLTSALNSAVRDNINQQARPPY